MRYDCQPILVKEAHRSIFVPVREHHRLVREPLTAEDVEVLRHRYGTGR